jgi:phosphoglycerate dehydrogenase-like enzyme
MKVAVLDDYQNVALQLADWSGVRRHAEITVFNDHVADPSAVVERLRPFDAVCVMRERTPLTREILQQLPNLKLIASTGPRNASIETQTAADLGIAVTATGYDSTPTIEFTWSLILASMRGIDREAVSLRAGGWQTSLGSNLRGKSLGVVGLGNIGREVARIGLAFGMKVIAWSQNLTEERASAAGATLVGKQTLFREADVVTVHLVLGSRTRGLIGAPEFALMKPKARFVMKRHLTFVTSKTPSGRARCVLLYFTETQYRQYEKAALQFGATRRGRGLVDKEAATIRMSRAAMRIGAGASRID